MQNQELIIFFKKLLITPSFDPTKSNVPEVIIETFNRHDIDYEILTSNGIRNIVAKTKGEHKIILNGHWDTVLPSKEFKKNTLPIEEENGLIHGVGACDMKSGVAAMVGCFIECAKNNIPGVVLCLVGDEESGGENGTGYLVKHGILAPYVILGEPTNLALSLGQKAIVAVTAKAHGKEAHGAYPYRGDNAILKMYLFIQEVLHRFPIPEKHVKSEEAFNMTTVSIDQISGGTALNVVPDSCVVKMDVRVSAKSSIKATEEEFSKLAHHLGVDVSFGELGVGWEFDQDTRIFSVSEKAVANQTKKPAISIKKLGSNDGKYYLPHRSEIVNIGPGDNKLIHTSNEKISTQEIITAKNIYLEIIKNLQ